MRFFAVCGALLVLGLTPFSEESILSNFKYGIEWNRIFNLDSEFFAPQKSSNVFSGVFMAVIRNIVGDENDIGNAIIEMSVQLAKKISDALGPLGRRSRRVNRDFSLLDAVLRQPQVMGMLRLARNPNLTEDFLRDLQGPDCVKLLACKMAPFVRGMQKSLGFFVGEECSADGVDTCRKWAKSRPIERMYFFLPTMDEFIKNGDSCDDRHPLCVY